MTVIVQYESMISLYIYIVLLIPAVILGLVGKKIKFYGIAATIPAVVLMLGIHTKQMYQFLVFLFLETLIVYTFFYLRRRCRSELLYFVLFGATVFPVIMIKGCIYTSFHYLGFLGISYISFRIWQIMIEIHDGRIVSLPFDEFVYFITFFPSFSSGPIDRFAAFKDSINKKIEAGDYFENYFCKGILKILIGILYKFCIAFFINTIFLQRISEEITFAKAVTYMYVYTLYLFFDFAGYSQFAIGTGYLLGVKLPENFNKPFLARNMKEFWERWHMSLSRWFNDYLYSRFVLNNIRNGMFKNRKAAARCGYLFSMIIMGLWHGFQLHFLIYGFYEGLLLVMTDLYLKSKIYRNAKEKKYFDWLSRIVNFHVAAFGMLLFSGFIIHF